MKKLLLVISSVIFSQFSFAEQYPNSWKMDIQCKDGVDKWYEANFVVDALQ